MPHLQQQNEYSSQKRIFWLRTRVANINPWTYQRLQSCLCIHIMFGNVRLKLFYINSYCCACWSHALKRVIYGTHDQGRTNYSPKILRIMYDGVSINIIVQKRHTDRRNIILDPSVNTNRRPCLDATLPSTWQRCKEMLISFWPRKFGWRKHTRTHTGSV